MEIILSNLAPNFEFDTNNVFWNNIFLSLDLATNEVCGGWRRGALEPGSGHKKVNWQAIGSQSYDLWSHHGVKSPVFILILYWDDLAFGHPEGIYDM